ncbi:CG30020, partial [Drosophila busckii]
ANMARKRAKMEDPDMESSINYKFACRCCLKSEAEFFKLDALTDVGSNDDTTTKIPLIRLLLFCMRTENLPELPQYICIECSKSLQIAYYFIQNGLRAHEILCSKLCPAKSKGFARLNGQQQQHQLLKVCILYQARHECKICGATIHNRLELKQHIRMHTENTGHRCKLCKFVTLRPRQLSDHYRKAHNLTTAQIEHQLKMRSLQAATAVLKDTAATATPATEDGQVKVCTLEDMEMLIPTVLTPEDFSRPQLDDELLHDIENQVTAAIPTRQSSSASISPTDANSANVSIGAEFLVMSDGSLQQVNDAGVVFEYIDNSKSNSSSNISLQNLLSDPKSPKSINYVPMDTGMSDINVGKPLPKITGKIVYKKHKCKLCPSVFPSLERLKSHQLSHSRLPKFYCDQCAYFSLRSQDLMQHYKTEHKLESDNQQLLEQCNTMDVGRIFSCDMCLFDTPSSGELRLHYSDKHAIQPNEVQLRPSWSMDAEPKYSNKANARNCENSNGKQQPQTQTVADIPIGIKYPSISTIATAEERAGVNILTDAENQQQQESLPQPTTTAVVTPTGDINVIVDATSLFYAVNPDNMSETNAASSTEAEAQQFQLFPEQALLTASTTTTSETEESLTTLPGAASDVANTSIFGDMQEFIDNADVAAICTIPADDMPVVDGDDIVIDNNNISLDFDTENLFDDFEGDEEDVVEDEEAESENDDENDNNLVAADQNLLLTSDDDDLDDFDDEQSKNLQKPYCIFCKKKFTSQYKFENHMFSHRGLAPYRCELCTNLYNMKRLLIRHYKTVHKRMPTRDMVQAKGDKVSVASLAIEKLHIDANKRMYILLLSYIIAVFIVVLYRLSLAPIVMCAQCPFECEEEGQMRKHLNAHHGINDGSSAHANEVFIIRKLPYECPRCIRSFAAKRTLTRHLQRSHLVDTIIEMQAPQLTANTDTGIINSPSEQCEDAQVQNASSLQIVADIGTSSDPDSGVGDADGKSGKIFPVYAEETSIEPVIAGSEVEDTATQSAEHTLSTSECTISTTGMTSSAKTAGSSLYPTPFDFELDFMSNGTPNTKNPTDSFNVVTSGLLNGSDKLLSAALELSPAKNLRSSLPRTPIFVCKQCNQTFDELSKLSQHEMDQHANDDVLPRSSYQHQCKICNTTYRTVTLLNYHMKRHAARRFECKQCAKTFALNADLEQHIKIDHRNVYPLKCGIGGCKKIFNYKHHLKRHQTASHNSVNYICPECGKDMMTSLHLRHHLTSHRSSHLYKCPKCVRTYTRR